MVEQRARQIAAQEELLQTVRAQQAEIYRLRHTPKGERKFSTLEGIKTLTGMSPIGVLESLHFAYKHVIEDLQASKPKRVKRRA